MYATAFSIVRHNILGCLAFLALNLSIDLASRTLSGYLGMLAFVSNALFSYYVYRAILFGETFDLAGPTRADFRKPFLKFLWRSIVLGMLLLLVAMIVSLPVLFANGGTRIESLTIAVALVGAMSAATLFVYAWVGTWLPATVYDKAASFEEARLRSKTTLKPSLAALLVPTAIGPFDSLLRGLGVVARFLPASMQIQDDSLDYWSLTAIALGCVLELVITALYATALAKAYLNAEQPHRDSKTEHVETLA